MGGWHLRQTNGALHSVITWFALNAGVNGQLLQTISLRLAHIAHAFQGPSLSFFRYQLPERNWYWKRMETNLSH